MGKTKRGSKDRQREAEERRSQAHKAVPQTSAFDIKVTRRKHDVLNQRVKGDVGRPTKTRATGIALRDASLKLDFARRGSANVFADRRFGEYDKVSP
jgi:nucleolar protein 14